jgi:hypothetical protein
VFETGYGPYELETGSELVWELLSIDDDVRPPPAVDEAGIELDWGWLREKLLLASKFEVLR